MNMIYQDLLRALYHAGYTRIERDDRLLDVFPKETREKGIELWIKIPAKIMLRKGRHCEPCGQEPQGVAISSSIKILRVPSCPFNPKKLSLFSIPKNELEELLLKNKVADLSSYAPVASGNTTITHLS